MPEAREPVTARKHERHEDEPIQNCQYCGVIVAKPSCIALKTTAPSKPP